VASRHFLTRISLGLLRVPHTPTSREVVFLGRPIVLLRFHAPRDEVEADRGGHLADRPRPARRPARTRQGLPQDQRRAPALPRGRRRGQKARKEGRFRARAAQIDSTNGRGRRPLSLGCGALPARSEGAGPLRQPAARAVGQRASAVRNRSREIGRRVRRIARTGPAHGQGHGRGDRAQRGGRGAAARLGPRGAPARRPGPGGGRGRGAHAKLRAAAALDELAGRAERLPFAHVL
jgi:hypothetical protein